MTSVRETRAAARLVGVSKTYGSGDAEVRALDDVTVDLAAGEFTAIMGPSSRKAAISSLCAACLSMRRKRLW